LPVALDDARILIIGLGLMGGSLGLALRGRAGQVAGIDPDMPTREEALAVGAVDVAYAPGDADAAATADLLVLATPLGAMSSALRAVVPHLPGDAVVTDLGSVKGPIAREIARILPREVCYVPGHPMAGSEVAGIGGARADLYTGAHWILCGPSHPLVDEMVAATGATASSMDAERHDRIVAHTSHLPLVMAVTAASVGLRAFGDDPDGFLRLRAGGFRDTTRVAAGAPRMGADICTYNREELLPLVDGAIADLVRLREWIAEDDGGELTTFMSNVRETLLKARRSECSH